MQAARRPGRRQGDPDEVWHTVEAPWPSAEGHRVVWVKSSSKIDYDADTRYRRITRTHHRVVFTVDEDQVAHDAASDGMFPLISNDRDLSDAELLTAYKYQPNLEKRHAQLKGTQLVAPMFLHDPARIEGLLCCHFIAMLVQALIERQIRSAMKTAGLQQLSIYPEDRGCAAPTTARILDIFTGLARHHLTDQHGRHVQTFQPQLTELQALVLDLLEVPRSVCTA